MRSQRVNCGREKNRPVSGGSFLVARPAKLWPRPRRIMKAGHGDRARRAGRAIGDRIMSGQTFTRRAAIAACGAFVLVTAMGSGAAQAQSPLAIGAIRVDVAPLRANAGDPTATWVEQELPRQLAEALSGRLTPKGATLVVRIDSLTIGPNKDDRAWDNIGGVAMLGGVARPVRATSRYWASAIDQALFEQSNHARVSAVAQALAVWIARDF
jgi:hypothetical protein